MQEETLQCCVYELQPFHHLLFRRPENRTVSSEVYLHPDYNKRVARLKLTF